MNLATLAIKNRAVTYFAVVLIVVGGLISYRGLGQLEDPEFTIKTAVIMTPYPGASPREVELEVTDPLEQAIQEMPQLDRIRSYSSAGMSSIKVDIKDEFWSDSLPQIWDELRKKISDKARFLPPGAGNPLVLDDFGQVYGFVLAVSGDGFTTGELQDYVDVLKKELSLVPGVAKVQLWGKRAEVVYVDVSESQLSELGISRETIAGILADQNVVVNAGSIEVQDERIRIAPSGEFLSPEDIGNLVIHGKSLDDFSDPGLHGTEDDLVRIRDIATIRRGYEEPMKAEMRQDGRPAIDIALTNIAGANIVEVGERIDARITELLAEIPVGIEVSRVAWQSDQVTAAIDSFLISLIEAVLIVLVVLTVPMGWRMGVIIGTGLVLTILGTFMAMAALGIDLQRMSLGALVIALGMMVDNSIVVADGIAVRLKRGMNGAQAAAESVAQATWPLFGATLVAVMAFYPIAASTASTGEYCGTLFSVVAISLLLSWLLAVTVTAVQCVDMLKSVKDTGDEYSGRFYRGFRGFLGLGIRFKVPFVGILVALLVVSFLGFPLLPQNFFPDSSRADFMIDYWAPHGTRIEQVSDDVRVIEERVRQSDSVKGVSTFIGQGPPRFYLPVEPEGPNPGYAQLIIQTGSHQQVNDLVKELQSWFEENVPHAMVRVRKFGVGPADTWPLEARFSGPAEADLTYLRSLGEKGMEILHASPQAKDIRLDVRDRVKKVVPVYAQERALWASIGRSDIAEATRRAYDGIPVGLYREGDTLLPILMRNRPEERAVAASNLSSLQVKQDFSPDTVPLSQVTDDIRVEWEEPIIHRYNRRRAVTVQCSPNGTTFPALLDEVRPKFEAIELPVGYDLAWDAEFRNTQMSRDGLKPGLIPAVVIMIFLIVMLFNAYRPPIVIFLTVPFAMIGVTSGLLLFHQPFGFLSLLGAMSLAGMMIKNAIVLLDQVKPEIEKGSTPYQAILDAAVSRLRPVVLAAATTVLGVIPLLQDVFWVSMAVTIMAGLAFGTVLTMVVVPVLYAIFYRVSADKAGKSWGSEGAGDHATPGKGAESLGALKGTDLLALPADTRHRRGFPASPG